MISKQSLQILGLILLISAIFGCIGNNSNNSTSSDFKNIKPGFGIVGDSEFELEPEWYQKSVSNYSSDFNFNGTGNFVVLMKVYQHPNKSEYDGNYATAGRKTSDWRVSTGTKTIENVNIKTIKVTRLSGEETILYYFFEKNGKYYQIFIDIGGTEGIQYFNDNKIMDRTINTIVRTIH